MCMRSSSTATCYTSRCTIGASALVSLSHKSRLHISIKLLLAYYPDKMVPKIILLQIVQKYSIDIFLACH